LIDPPSRILLDFCEQVLAADGPITSNDLGMPSASRSDRFRLGDLRFLAGIALRGTTANAIGVLLIGDVQPRRTGIAELGTLHRLGHIVEQFIGYRAELRRGADVQRSLRASAHRDVPDWDCAGVSLPASHIGGSYLDWHVDDQQQLTVTVADVLGNGAGAGILAATVRAAIRSATSSYGFHGAMDAAAAILEADLEASGGLATVFHARCAADGVIDYVNAGHPLSFRIGPNGASVLSASGLPLGITAAGNWTTGRLSLRATDSLVVVSDGVVRMHGGVEQTVAAAERAVHETPAVNDIALRLSSPSSTRRRPADVTVVVLRPRV
jgi:serine phosphatase RsbU (regulator of sigma subunit)